MQDGVPTHAYPAGDTSDDLLVRSASRLFAAFPTTQAIVEGGGFPEDAWRALAETGLHLALLPIEADGVGLPPREAMELLRIAGEHLTHVPLAETMLAGWLLAKAGLSVPDGPLSAAPILPSDTLTLTRNDTGWHLVGTAHRVPWGRHVVGLAVMAMCDGASYVVSLPRGGWRSEPGTNLAFEPRDIVHIDVRLDQAAAAPSATGVGFEQLRAVGAAMRSMMIAGALARLLRMTVQ